MRRLIGIFLTAGAVALTFAAAGCNRGAEEAGTPPAATPPAAGAAAPAGAVLATEQAAGPFLVTLAADPAQPTEGDTRFTATVTRDGKPVTDAEVKLSLSMPTMNMGGPEVDLGHTDGGRYEETADLSMGGAWEAKVTVSDEGETGTSIYNFNALQK